MTPRSITVLALFLATPGFAQTTELGSVASIGGPGNGQGQAPSISADGRYLAFLSTSSNIVAGDGNGQSDVFVRDRVTGAVERVSVDSNGNEGNGYSVNPSISADGRYVAFWSAASNLVAGDTNNVEDIFVHDRQTGATERVSVSSAGVQANDRCYSPSISGDGRYVAFGSQAGNLIPNSNGWNQVYVRDRQAGTTVCASVSTGGALANNGAGSPAISRNGRWVSFETASSNLAVGDNNGANDVYVHDLIGALTERVSVSTTGGDTDGNSAWSTISGDGRYVQFCSVATNVVAGDTNGRVDIFVRDRQTHTTERVSVATGGGQSDSDAIHSAISDDGRYSVFSTWATNLVAGDTNGYGDVFLRDRQAGTTELVSRTWDGNPANYASDYSSVSDDARYVAFDSGATNLVPIWLFNGDVYVRDRSYVVMTSACDPGSGGVAACPCGNPPAGAGRGCDNSAGTGGASLSAAGTAYLGMDRLVFTTNGEKSTATSVLLQGTSTLAAGTAYGQGVRCVGGTMKRLFTKAAVAGSVTMPDSNAGDPSISARSVALGSPIAAGETRSYLVFYRDPVVLGGCGASRTFNATQTGLVTWRP
jgi:Tol biopolymer transport system component